MSVSSLKTSLFALLKFTGEDAENFLQGQISQDVRTLTSTEIKLAAYCSPKGRLLANFWLWKDEGAIFALIRNDIAPAIHKRLQMYVLRAKVKIEYLPEVGIHLNAPTQETFSVVREGQQYLAYFGANRALVYPVTEEADSSTADIAWQQADILAKLPWIEAKTQEKFLAQALDFDALGGISYTKGCYTGQEVIARTHYRGKIKRGLFLKTLDSINHSIEAGGDFTLENGEVVEVVNVVHADKTALLYVGQLHLED